MSRNSFRHFTILLIVMLLLSLPAAAADRAGRQAVREDSLFERVRAWLERVWTGPAETAADPRHPAIEATGALIDPNGIS